MEISYPLAGLPCIRISAIDVKIKLKIIIAFNVLMMEKDELIQEAFI